MPIYQTFVLGKKESYFFNTPTHWAWHNLPPDIEALFTKTPAIQDVIEFTFGEHGTYFVSYRDHDGQILAKHYNLPNALTSWLYQSQPAIVRDISTLSISLGTYDSYYAWDKSSASWSNLPPKLEKSIMDRVENQDAWRTVWKANGAEAPCFVSLGADEAYWMRTVSGGGCWDLKCATGEAYDGLKGINKFLEDSNDFSGVAGLHLFPSHGNAYILITTSGKPFSNLPEFTWVDYNKMSPALPMSIQSMLPIPPIPQPRQQATPQGQLQPQAQFQQQQLQQQQVQQPMYAQQQYQQQMNCCPQATGAPHNCCPPAHGQQQQQQQFRPLGVPIPGYVAQHGYLVGAGYQNQSQVPQQQMHMQQQQPQQGGYVGYNGQMYR